MRHIETLENGIRVAIEPMDHVNSVSFGIWVATGSRYENERLSGAAHFIEHMLFKGTTNRSAREIAEMVEERGGSLNAFTSREATCYYVKALAEDLGFCMDVLADMFFHSSFAGEEILREKNVVLEEINMYEDTPDELIHDLQLASLYHEHPLGNSILGTARSIGGLTRDDLLSFLADNYAGDTTVLSVAGNVDPAEVMALVRTHFGSLAPKANLLATAEPVEHRGFHFVPKKTEQINFCLGRVSFPREHPDFYKLLLLNNLLGGSASSRLFQEIREKRGLVYSTYSYLSTFNDSGTFTIYGGTSPDSFNEVLQIVGEIYRDLREGGITARELERNRNQIRAQLLLAGETASSRMKKMGGQLLGERRIIEDEEIIAAMDAVTLEDLHSFARDFLDLEQSTLTFIGPGADERIQKTWENLGGCCL